MCCSVGFARSLGLALLPLALCCILANLLLLFPMGEMTYIEQGRLASYIWYFGGLGGGGLLMCGSVLAAVVGLVGASYCFVVSGLALMQGPLCFTSLGWSYPFADQGGYLLQSATWSQCLQPLHIVEWNVTLLCVLLGLAVLEFILCFLQLASGVVNAICRPCCYKQEYNL
uniref:Transmembrane 4 L six family member 1 n=1 Tax=Hippocampus comes TaxID=109280 RepID=A0A3Q2Y8D2_HIPCM